MTEIDSELEHYKPLLEGMMIDLGDEDLSETKDIADIVSLALPGTCWYPKLIAECAATYPEDTLVHALLNGDFEVAHMLPPKRLEDRQISLVMKRMVLWLEDNIDSGTKCLPSAVNPLLTCYHAYAHNNWKSSVVVDLVLMHSMNILDKQSRFGAKGNFFTFLEQIEALLEHPPFLELLNERGNGYVELWKISLLAYKIE